MIIAGLFAAALASSAAGSASEPGQTVQLSPAQMLRLAEVAESRGDASIATSIYAALENDRDHSIRSEARFRRAKQLIAAKRLSAAALLLRRLLDDEPDATAVRLQLAALFHQMGENDRALAQLRAAQATRLPASVSRLIDRYSEALRAQRPFGASFEVALAPDSNINRATRSDTLGTVIGEFEIGKDSKARSGTGLALHASGYRRFGLGMERMNLVLRTNGSANLYRSEEFNEVALDISAGPEIQLGPTRLNLEAGATQRWFGRKPFVRSVQIGLTLARPLGRRSQVRLNTTAATIDNRLNDLQDGKRYSAHFSFEHALSPIAGVVVTAGADRQRASDPAYSTKGWSAGATVWRDFGRLTLAAGGEIGRLHADQRLMLFPHTRADSFSRLSLAASFRRLQVRGFAPLVRASFERNRSSVEIYDYRRTRLELGIVRAF